MNPMTTPNGRKGFFFKKSNLWVRVQTDKLDGTNMTAVQLQHNSGGDQGLQPQEKAAPKGRSEETVL